MRVQTYDIGTWLYPDSVITEENRLVCLDSPRNGDACFQILTDMKFAKDTEISWKLDAQDADIEVVVYELRPVLVKYNSGATYYNATCWDNVKDFVVRQAPYEVYELTRPIDDGVLWGDTGATAFMIRLNVGKDVSAGKKKLGLQLHIGEEVTSVEINLHVHKVELMDAKDSPYPMGFWIYPKFVCWNHNVERFTEEYYYYIEKIFQQMANTRCNHIQLPTPIPVRDESGKVVDFDFTECDRFTEYALKYGFQYIQSGFIAKWAQWEEPQYYLKWFEDDEEQVQVESLEGYRQICLYIEKTKEFIKRHNIEKEYWQSFVDEPQLKNSLAYKALNGTFRKMMPDMKLMDPIESPHLVGSCDIWVIKQAVYEKYKEQYDMLREMGEKFWVYTCGFPANKWMNHIIDLPISATRLITWQGVRHYLDGFNHYGYLEFNPGMDPMYDTDWGRIFQKEMRYFPPGNGNIIYTDRKVLYDSVRAHVHRIGAAEGELLLRLRELDEKACFDIIDSVCTTFEEYTSDSALVESARKALLDKLDEFC